jgi:hypothetical protein
MRDIYDPPPAPVAWTPPKPEPLPFQSSDLIYLAGLCLLLCLAGYWAWSIEPILGLWVSIGGVFVIFESWFSAITYLHRHPDEHPGRRWMIFLAALVPWLIGLGFATALMLGLFLISDMSG